MKEMEKSNKQPEKILTFEDFKQENGMAYWWASDLLLMLGYQNIKQFMPVLNRVTKALVSLNISHYDNIIATEKDDKQNFKMTRFACYLAVMNANPKKQEVAKAQVYFAEQTRKFELYIKNNKEIDRLLTREELVEGNKSLNTIIKNAGVEDYAKFQQAGYLGLYNMPNWKLAQKRNVEKRKLLDNMGRTELAANLFRITQTEERIKNKHITGQSNLEQTHHDVGREVRNIIKKNTGKDPENLPQEKQLPEVKKELKKGYRNMQKEDKKK